MRNNTKYGIKTYAFLLLSVFSVSKVSAMDVEGFGMLSADFGGDSLVGEITYSDGSTAEMNAGRGLMMGAGINAHLNADILLQATASLKYQTIPQASNGNLTWIRIPLEVSALYKFDKIRLGGGIAYHLMNNLKGTGVASAYDVDYDNALGFNALAEYMVTPKFSLTARYSVIDYTSTLLGSANGNSFGAGFNWYFK